MNLAQHIATSIWNTYIIITIFHIALSQTMESFRSDIYVELSFRTQPLRSFPCFVLGQFYFLYYFIDFFYIFCSSVITS